MGITISNSQRLWLGFSLWKHFSTYVGIVSIYSMGRDRVYRIWQNSKIECFAGISLEGLTCETLTKTSCHYPVMTFHIPVMCWAHTSLCGKVSRELPVKTSLVFNCLESSHSFSHTTLTIKSHIKCRVQKIKYNYN